MQQSTYFAQDAGGSIPQGNVPQIIFQFMASALKTTQLKISHHYPVFQPSKEVGILGNPLMHLGGHVILGVILHTKIYHPKFHPVINNHNSGTHRIGKTGLHNMTILGYKDGEEGIPKETLKIHLSLCPLILTPSFHRTYCIFFQVLFPHLYLLFHKNPSNTRIESPQDRHYYRHNRCPT